MVKTTDYKINDWLFCEFKLQQILEIRDGQIVTVSDGWFQHSSSSLNNRCFALDKKVKIISDNFESWRSRLHKEGHRSLNYPDIICALIEKWCEACELEDNAAIQNKINELDDWGKGILSKCEELKLKIYNGIKLFN